MLKREDLEKPNNLKILFGEIRNHLAGMAGGVTRDEALAREMINLLLCKMYDEINTMPHDELVFQCKIGEPHRELKDRIASLFNQKVKIAYSDVLEDRDEITLDDDSLRYVVKNLQRYCLRDADRDAIIEAFEVFIGPALRGAEGQFFTPRNVVDMMISILDPSKDELVIDPACGTGGFLVAALDYNMTKNEARDRSKHQFFGIDKDAFLAKVAKAYMAVVGDGRKTIFSDNSLENPTEWKENTRNTIKLGSYDIVITNPPHGAKIVVQGRSILSQYALAHIWVRNQKTWFWTKSGKLRGRQTPQVLFIERCVQLLKPGGRMGIVLPESLFGNPSHGYITDYLMDTTQITGIVSMPEELFQPHTHQKTCIVFVKNVRPSENYDIFMGIASWCGHDSRGNTVPYDDLPEIARRYHLINNRDNNSYDRLAFVIKRSEIKNNILVPKYYDPGILSELDELKTTHDLVRFGDLLSRRIISVSTGVEVGKLSYGTGDIPFIRTSDLSNWEMKSDPKQGISEKKYDDYGEEKKVRENDILLVRDGTYLIGTTAMVTKYDTRVLFQSHIYRIRVMKPKEMSPFLLLAVLNCPIVKKQIRSKQFTQDIIDTLGRRIHELILPIPKEFEVRKDIIKKTERIVSLRAELRQLAREVSVQVQGRDSLSPEDRILVGLT